MNTIIKLIFIVLALVVLLWALSLLSLPSTLMPIVYILIAVCVLVVAYRIVNGQNPLP